MRMNRPRYGIPKDRLFQRIDPACLVALASAVAGDGMAQEKAEAVNKMIFWNGGTDGIRTRDRFRDREAL